MNVREYLKKHQPTVYQVLSNSIKNKQLSHAYLLAGSPGTPLLEIAEFIAKSIICDNPIDYLADETCPTCKRIENNNYSDLIILDGKKAMIKKDDVAELEDRFAYKTPLESKGVMFYIINLVENMYVEAINALLKFLEEPSENVYAILTCENEYRVLPTILSRTQILHLKNVDLKELKNEAESISIPQEDIELLVHFYNDAQLIKEVAKSEDYLRIKECFKLTLDALKESSSAALFNIHKNVTPLIKSKEDSRLYLDFLSLALQDLLNISIQREINLKSYGNILDILSKKLKNIEDSYIEVINAKSKIEWNVNISLLIDHIIIFITQGGNDNGRNGK